MVLFQLLIAALMIGASQGQPACPQGLQTTASTVITTNDVILITAPLLPYADAANACQCLGAGYTAANASEFFTSRPGFNDQNQAASDGLRSLVSTNLGSPATVWFGPRRETTGFGCPMLDVSPGLYLGGPNFGDCQRQYAIVCSRSKKVFNPVGSTCDNNLQLCQRGGYCNSASGKCETDTVCYPNNPCATTLGNQVNLADVICTVTPGAPGGYTCQCGIAQVVSPPPGPPTCYLCPSANPCAVNRCPSGTSCDYQCGPVGVFCVQPDGTRVPPITFNPPPPPPSNPPPSGGGDNGVCGSGESQAFPVRCYFNSDPQGRYVCCDSAGCDGFNPPDNLFPHCKANGHVPPGYGVNPPATGAPPTSPSPPSGGSQGVCGSGEAQPFPVRCYFNSDPQGRYVCCDSAGCDGFNAPDYLFPHCKANGFVPPGYGVNTPPQAPPTPTGSQGVCGSGDASAFPQRCYFNSDPQGRYVCCDSAGCDGFNPPDYKFPHCKANGYVPPGYGV